MRFRVSASLLVVALAWCASAHAAEAPAKVKQKPKPESYLAREDVRKVGERMSKNEYGQYLLRLAEGS